MKIKSKIFFVGFALSVTSLLYVNCSSMDGGGTTGTGTGNPLYSAQLVAQSLCTVISNCAPQASPVSANSCYTNIQTVTNIVPLLGASATTFPTFGDLIAADLAGTIAADATAASGTAVQILAQSCSSTSVQNIFSGGTANYSNVAPIVPTSGVAIFSPATQIFRSVGPGNTTPLVDGSVSSIAMTISSGSATFASPLPNNVGVGDAVVYDCNGDSTLGAGDCVAFIASRASSMAYTLQNASGGTPANYGSANVWRIYRAYTSIADVLDETAGGTENPSIVAIDPTLGNFDTWSGSDDIVSSNQQWNVAVYADGSSSSGTCMTGWRTDSTHYVRVYAPMLANEVGITQRQVGAWDPSKLVVNNSGINSIAFGTEVSYTVIEGLELEGRNTVIDINSAACFGGGGSAVGITVADNIIQLAPTAGASRDGIGLRSSVAGNYYIYNNIIFGANGSATNGIENNSSGAITAYIYNNTVYGLDFGILNLVAPGVYVLKNNISVNNAVRDYSATVDDSDYNLSSDNSAPGSNSKTTQTVIFVNAAAGDLRISVSDTTAKGAGTDLSSDPYLAFTTDIAGIIRTVPWDIGASTPH